jgi:hypothetical protein
MKQQLRLGSKVNFNEDLRQTIVLEFVKLAAGSSVRSMFAQIKNCGARETAIAR